MNIIGQIDPSAFASAQRMHHREDEPTSEFPSSASSRARGLLALKAQNWRAAKKSAPAARDYVQEGLVAMWDGIENAGWGVHDATSTLWKDLAGSNNISLTMGDGHWNDDSLMLAKSVATKGTCSRNNTYRQIEVVACEIDGVMSYNRHIMLMFGDRFHYVAIGNGYGVMFCGDNDTTYKGLHRISSFAGEKFSASVSYGEDDRLDVNSMYYNGVKETPNGSSIGYGNSNSGINLYGSYQANCNLYSVRLYSRALTAAEVAHNYEVDKARFGLP